MFHLLIYPVTFKILFPEDLHCVRLFGIRGAKMQITYMDISLEKDGHQIDDVTNFM